MYEVEVARIKKDLGIEGAVVHLTFLNTRWAGKRNRWGWHQLRKDKSHNVDIAYGGLNGKRRSYKNVVRTIAHELRHVKQYEAGWQTDVRSGRSWIRIWTGTPLAPTPLTWRKMRYRAQPHEIDAFVYMDEAWNRLFSDLPRPSKAGIPSRPKPALSSQLAYLFLEAAQ